MFTGQAQSISQKKSSCQQIGETNGTWHWAAKKLTLASYGKRSYGPRRAAQLTEKDVDGHGRFFTAAWVDGSVPVHP